MTTQTQTNQQGFTLVELAIVLVIVGLLIGGILKGQELIGNAQVSSQIAQMKGTQSAFNAFRDQYNALAGDFRLASTRIANCNADPTCVNGAGNNRLGLVVGAVPTAANEGYAFFNQMRVANLLSGFDGQNLASFGNALPTASTGGGYFIGDTRAGAAMTGFTVGEFRPGVYLVSTGQVVNVAGQTGNLTPAQAGTIDRRVDDGLPHQGAVISETTANCREGTTGYNEDLQTQLCSIAYRLGQ